MDIRTMGRVFLGLIFVAFMSTAGVPQEPAKARVIPFRIASDDPVAKFTFSKWSVMGKFEGEVIVTETNSFYLLRVALKRGELLASKSPQRILTVAPFLAKRHNKTFDFAARSSTFLTLGTVIKPGEALQLPLHEFQIEVAKDKGLSKYWLAFEIAVGCEQVSCTSYAHSSGSIFR